MLVYRQLKTDDKFKLKDQTGFCIKGLHIKLPCGGCKSLATGIVTFNNIMKEYGYLQVMRLKEKTNG